MTEAPARTLEARVTALEEALSVPSLRPPEQWTDEQVARFHDEFARLSAQPGVRWRPPAPVLTPETARALLRECVTVVQPGETLVIRVPDTWSPQQAEEYQEHADAATAAGRIPFKVVVVSGEELAVVQPETGEAFAARVRAVVREDVKRAQRMAAGDPFADKAAQRGG